MKTMKLLSQVKCVFIVLLVFMVSIVNTSDLKAQKKIQISELCCNSSYSAINIEATKVSNNYNVSTKTITNKFYFKNKRQKYMSLPFKLINNLIVIPMRINNSDTLNFIFDTGVRSTIITELPADESLVFKYLRKVTLRGHGKDANRIAYISAGNTFDISGIIGEHQNLSIMTENELDLSKKLGMDIHGLIGYDILKDFIIEIDFKKRRIGFFQPTAYNFKSRSKGAATLPLVIHQYKPYILTNITLDNGCIVPVSLLIDTGASDAMWLYLNSDKELSMSDNNVDTYLGHGLNGEIYGKKARIKKLDLGRYELKNPIIAFPEPSSVGQADTTMKINGIIGSEVFRRFKVTIDYQNKRISLRNNGELKDEFKYNNSGIEVATPYPGMPYYEIETIRKDSPAAKAGLQRNDRVKMLNGKKDSTYSLSEMYNILHNPNIKKLSLTIIRNGIEIKTELLLNKIL